MGLAWQQGPLAPGAIGRFLVPDPLPERLLYAEPLRRRVRVRFGGAWIADSEDVMLLHEPGRYPVAYFPLAAVSDGVMPAMSPDNGFLSAEQMAARYADGAGRDLSKLDWYIAFGYYKLAVISEGIHYRYLQGKTVGEGFSQMGERVPQLLDAALGLLADR